MSKKIFISTGEASGDLLAAELVQALKHQRQDLEFHGIGGQFMKNAGVNIHWNGNELSVIGLWEVLGQLKKIRAAFKFIKKFLHENKFDLIILIDFSGFNLRVAKIAKQAGIKVLYYVAPQIWAWRYYRIKTIKKCVNHVAVLYPFEEPIYQKEGVPVTFVGHPAVDFAKPWASRMEIMKNYSLQEDRPIIALLPGSRRREITTLLPIIMKAVAIIRAKLPSAQFVLTLAKHLKPQDIAPYISADVNVIHDDLHNVLSVSDAAIAVSGTVTLEAALHQVPHVIVYKVAFFTALILFFINLKLKYFGLSNLIANEMVAKEFMQYQAKPQPIAAEMIRLFEDETYRHAVAKKLRNIKTILKGENASQRAAQVAANLL